MTEDQSRWLSYSELAQVRGISRASAIRQSRKRQWPRQQGNDGTVRVLVPEAFLGNVKVKVPVIADQGSQIHDLTLKIEVLEGQLAAERALVLEMANKLAKVRDEVRSEIRDEVRGIAARARRWHGFRWGRRTGQ